MRRLYTIVGAMLHRKIAFLWAIIYFTSIPLFGAIYTNMPNSFYAPYAILEPEAERDRATLEHIIENHFSKMLSDSTYKVDVSIDNIDVKTDDTMDMSISVKLDAAGSDEKRVFERGNVSEYIFGVHGNGHLYKASGTLDDYLNGSNRGINHHIFIFFPSEDSKQSNFYKYVQSRNYNYVDLNDNEEKSYTYYLLGAKGDPTKLSRPYIRMTYFSAVVATTVGFGDIVPLTTAARALAAVEAMFGIFMGGLFLASVGSPVK